MTGTFTILAAVAIGLPHASNTGVVFMRVTVSEADGCGAYSCFVSPDATGTSWTSMPILTDVPTVQAGCGLEAEPSDYSLVAQIPRDTICTGEGSACLVMCKNEVRPMNRSLLRLQMLSLNDTPVAHIQKTELGNCAAIAFSPAGAGEAAPSASTSSAALPVAESAPPASSSSATPLFSTATTVISSFDATSVITSTRIVSATQTTVVRPSASLARVTPSTPAASVPASGAFPSSAASGKAIATIVAFSGENGPGGLAEQQKIGTHAFAVTAGEQEDEQTSRVARAVQPAAASVAAVILAAIYAACFA